MQARHADPLFQESLPTVYLYCDGNAPLLFTENETNHERIFGAPNASPYVKDGINNFVVHGNAEAVNPAQTGTKAAAHYRLTVGAGATQTVRLRLTTTAPGELATPFAEFDATVATRVQEADDFYRGITPVSVQADVDRAQVMRQALAGMLWTKQYFYYDLDTWLTEHQANPISGPAQRRTVRNAAWYHMLNDDIISMPDKWEYPWYAAWDLAFHTLALAMVDPDFAKQQLDLMLRERLPAPQRPDSRLRMELRRRQPAGPRLGHLFLPHATRNAHGKGDVEFLKHAFQKLLAQLHLVGQPQGPRRAERLRGRLPRPRQHRRLRPQRAAAHRRLPGAGGRHRLDGLLQPEHARDRPRTGAPRPALRGHGVSKFFEHFDVDRLGDGPHRRTPGRDVGRGGRLLLRRAAPAGRRRPRLKVRSMVGLLPLCSHHLRGGHRWSWPRPSGRVRGVNS
jgi:hypothetical protein